LPQEVLNRLRSETKKVLELPEVREKLHGAGGLEPFVTSPDEFAALIRRDYERFGRLIKEVGIKAD
jgi:tripartite-type tricarboxylate transporter receptor subunit TctC